MAPTRTFRRRDILGTLKWALLPAVFLTAACDPAAFGSRGGSGGRVQVALLVPTGSTDPQVIQLANDLSRAGTMAAQDAGENVITLRTYSTAGDASVAAQAAQQAVRDGADVIVGPLYAQNAAAVGRAVAGSGTAVLTFSNNTDIAGGNVFLLGNTFENTANQLGQYAAKRGKRRVVIVNGREPSEQFARQAITSGIAGTGVQIVGSADFEYSQEGIVAAMPNIANSALNAAADTLFLASSIEGALPVLSSMLPDYGLGPNTVQYIGLTRWDSLRSATSLPGLQGGWFAIPDPDAISGFRSRYIATYGDSPVTHAELAYDGITAIAEQARKAGAAGVTPQALVAAGSFSGATGSFRFLSDGTNRRGMAIASIQNNTVVILQKAPTSLGSSGS